MMLDEESGVVPNPSVAKLAELAQNRLGEMSDLQEARGLHSAVARFNLARGPSSRRFPLRFWLVGAGAVTALVLLAWMIGPLLVGRSPLTCVMSQGEIQAGGYFRSGPQAQPTIQFSDGTKLDIMAGSRGRIATVDAHGARVMLDHGEAYVQVVARPGARWLFDAGPFVVHVHGTEFVLAWNADEGRLDLRLHKGAVSVTGPLSDEAIALHAGQWLTVRVGAREVFVRDFDREASRPLSGGEATAAAPADSAPGVAPPAPAQASMGSPGMGSQGKVRRSVQASPLQSANAEVDWGAARAEGDWKRILDLATRRGIDQSIAERSSEDLALLADAAHYLRRDDIASQALLAQRRRFPGSTRARDAAFLLGRIIEARTGGDSEALGWYDRHLAEAPDGAYASEALGRKMTVLARLHGEEAARPVAEEYLRRYPTGTYVRAARAFAKRP